MLKAIYCGMGGNSFLCDVLKPVLLECGYDLTIISEWSNATVKWTRETWAKEMVKGDVVICPQREGIQDGKSSIKAVTAMALGMPVIASPIPAYTEAIQQGENGFLASIHRLDEWRTALNALKDASTRQRIGKAARETAKRYSLDAVAGDWISLLREVSTQSEAAPVSLPEIKPVHETVDLIVATYNNLPYIKLCLNSIWMNTDSPYRIIVSDAGSGPETWDYLKSLQGIVLLGSPGQRLNYSEAINAGVAAGNSKYFCVMNSDLIVSRGWLKAMVSHMGRVDRLACLGNLSNCNIDWTISANYIQPIESKGTTLKLRAGMKIDEFGPHIEALNHFMAASNEQHKGVYHKREWVAAYCSLYARCAWEEVGGFDPIYKNGCEDLDHCIRLRRAGYEIGEAFDAFIFHAGGISRGSYQAENRESYRKEDEYNHRVKDAKWGKKKIGIWTGPGWEKWTRETVDAGMGGSETWAAELAAEFSRRGNQVFLFGDCQEPHIDRDGVAYYPHQEMEDVLRYDWLDVLISSRSIEPIRLKNLHASQVFVMVHDVFIHQDPHHDLMDWRVKRFAYLSDWHQEFLCQHHKSLNPQKMFMTMNGVNQDLYHANSHDGLTLETAWISNPRIWKKNQSVYSSSPDRGLLQLLQIIPEIRKAVPDFRLLVAYGFHNWESAAKHRNNPQEMAHIAEIKSLMNQPGVEYLGRIDKKTLARHQMESKCWLMPEWFSETFSITAVENGLARNALLSSDLAGLKTTVGHLGGILIPWTGEYTSGYMKRFTEEAIRILQDDDWRRHWANSAYEKMKGYTWQAAADGWERQFGWK
jgi:glycosyltransferase involved in cell wall biosynthesis